MKILLSEKKNILNELKLDKNFQKVKDSELHGIAIETPQIKHRKKLKNEEYQWAVVQF